MKDEGEYAEPSWFTMFFTPPPVAKFSAKPLEGYYPLTVKFTDLSENYPTSWLWDFGDGETSKEQNPTHIYTKAGSIYTVTLTSTNENGSDTKTGGINVSTLQANFSAQPRKGKYPLIVYFTDKSIAEFGIESWHWDFGDGESSEEQDPIHIYKKRGVFTVSLTITGKGKTDTETKVGYIEATERSFTERRGVEARQEMSERMLNLRRSIALGRRLPRRRLIPVRKLEPMRDPPPTRVWR